MSNSSATVSLKLLIDTEAKRVLFAEAGKDCVDFLFYILSLPVAKIVSLVGKNEMVGSLSNLYKSIENLNESYVHPNQTRDALLKHVSSVATGSCVIPLLAIDAAATETKIKKKYYRCNCGVTHQCTCCCNGPTGFRHVADDPRAVCPTYAKHMDRQVEFVGCATGDEKQQVPITESGFVKEVMTYMVMDDLTVEPISTASGLALKEDFIFGSNVFALQKKVVSLGIAEAVKLLKASLESKNVLTRVFFNGEN